MERLNEDDRRAQARNVELVKMQLDAAKEQERQRMENEKRLEEMRAETALKVAQMESDAAVEQARVEAVSLADKTEKFSGREISKMMMAVQAAVYGTDECSLNAKSFKSIVDELIKDQRKKWNLLYKKTAWS